MKSKILCATMLTLALTIASISPCTVSAGKSSDVVIDTSKKDNNKPSEEEREQHKKKMEEAQEKWSKLTDEQKKSVYKLLEEEKSVSNKILDQLVSLEVFDQETAVDMKNKMAERLAKLIENGEFPFGGKCPKKDEAAKQSNSED